MILKVAYLAHAEWFVHSCVNSRVYACFVITKSLNYCMVTYFHMRMVWFLLTHWGRVTLICVSKLSIIGSYNGLSPARRQAIIWTNAGIFLIEPLGTKFNEILIEIYTFSFKKLRLKVSSAKRRPFCLGLNVLKHFSLLHLKSIYVSVLKKSILLTPS